MNHFNSCPDADFIAENCILLNRALSIEPEFARVYAAMNLNENKALVEPVLTQMRRADIPRLIPSNATGNDGPILVIALPCQIYEEDFYTLARPLIPTNTRILHQAERATYLIASSSVNEVRIAAEAVRQAVCDTKATLSVLWICAGVVIIDRNALSAAAASEAQRLMKNVSENYYYEPWRPANVVRDHAWHEELCIWEAKVIEAAVAPNQSYT